MALDRDPLVELRLHELLEPYLLPLQLVPPVALDALRQLVRLYCPLLCLSARGRTSQASERRGGVSNQNPAIFRDACLSGGATCAKLLCAGAIFRVRKTRMVQGRAFRQALQFCHLQLVLAHRALVMWRSMKNLEKRAEMEPDELSKMKLQVLALRMFNKFELHRIRRARYALDVEYDKLGPRTPMSTGEQIELLCEHAGLAQAYQ